MDITTHAIGSYNMSFASDLGLLIGSEKQFLARLKNKDEKRQYWENAAQHVKKFFEEKTPSFVGFQEMNDSDIISDARGEKGYQKLLYVLSDNKNHTNTPRESFSKYSKTYKKQGELTINNKNYQYFGFSVKSGDTFPSIISIINTDKVGEILFKESFGLDIGSGRPLSVVFTEEGYTLINLHGPNSKKASAEGNLPVVEKLKEIVTEHKALIDVNKFFIVGDFNDPYNSLKKLELGKDITLKYLGPAPKSCCYNFDSSCPDENLGEGNKVNTKLYTNSIVSELYDNFQDIDGEFVNKTCVTRISRPTVEGTPIIPEELEQVKSATLEELRNNSDLTTDDVVKIEQILNNKNGQELKTAIAKLRSQDVSQDLINTAIGLGQRGSLENYRFTGDYTFGRTPKAPLEIVPASNNEKI